LRSYLPICLVSPKACLWLSNRLSSFCAVDVFALQQESKVLEGGVLQENAKMRLSNLQHTQQSSHLHELARYDEVKLEIRALPLRGVLKAHETASQSRSLHHYYLPRLPAVWMF
jgi:hypothetical protein